MISAIAQSSHKLVIYFCQFQVSNYSSVHTCWDIHLSNNRSSLRSDLSFTGFFSTENSHSIPGCFFFSPRLISLYFSCYRSNHILGCIRVSSVDIIIMGILSSAMNIPSLDASGPLNPLLSSATRQQDRIKRHVAATTVTFYVPLTLETTCRIPRIALWHRLLTPYEPISPISLRLLMYVAVKHQ